MASIYLIHHAQASFGTENYDRLSPLGCRQSEVLGGYLRDCGIHFHAIYSGKLERQIRTAQIVASQQPVEAPHRIDSRFDEVRNDEHLEHLIPRVIETDQTLQELVRNGLKSSRDYQKAIEAAFNYWVSPQCDEPRIQSWADFSSDARNALLDVMKTHGSGKTVGVFTSGGTVATLVAQVLGLTGEQTYQFFEPAINCSVTRLFYSGSRVSLSYFNDHSFLGLLGQQLGEQLVTYR